MCVLCVRECVCVYVCDASIVRCVHVEVAWTSFVIFVCFFSISDIFKFNYFVGLVAGVQIFLNERFIKYSSD